MNTYLVAYYGSIVPTFAYAETLEKARLYALVLLNSQYCKRSDVLSIIDVADDSVIYYGKRNELIARFTAINRTVAVSKAKWPPLLKPVLNWISLKVTGPTVG